ncbi:prolipoprotein diacylglyceryl transferase family protein [Niabella yanshanensis]|uniref:Prolipoprotein diacylglyceryl transferase family protein n=1 Tax=Niabella yanshanensis TaxID=577386 RepID=A0ABZ0W9S7_9BACT|nr:prolipoprotein diacylglyceryl transferase family protein [Niabella yanshanensis]WQD39684.1 prolipoprotein diacylglyceryl transferase family protein [Niabella yanshanensis]
MYPDLYYLFRELLGIEWPLLHHITTFGLSIALSFVFGMYYLRKNLLLKESLGYFSSRKDTLVDRQKQAKVLPSKALGMIALINTICGIIIGKIFYLLENGQDLQPGLTMFSFSGINYYGALTGMLLSSAFFCYLNNIRPLAVFDAAAPGFLLSYCIGRLGCHISGDGDWGLVNNLPNPISWLPDWLWSYNYPHNLIRQGSIIKYCDWGNYCYVLSNPVWPTSLYEAIICFLLFLLLWRLRGKTYQPGFITGIYLIVSSLERFLIEEIRINPMIGELDITQAQLVSIILAITGVVIIGLLRFSKNRRLT